MWMWISVGVSVLECDLYGQGIVAESNQCGAKFLFKTPRKMNVS